MSVLIRPAGGALAVIALSALLIAGSATAPRRTADLGRLPTPEVIAATARTSAIAVHWSTPSERADPLPASPPGLLLGLLTALLLVLAVSSVPAARLARINGDSTGDWRAQLIGAPPGTDRTTPMP
jgi:hypothetical protein